MDKVRIGGGYASAHRYGAGEHGSWRWRCVQGLGIVNISCGDGGPDGAWTRLSAGKLRGGTSSLRSPTCVWVRQGAVVFVLHN